jgi:hypothetical protein
MDVLLNHAQFECYLNKIINSKENSHVDDRPLPIKSNLCSGLSFKLQNLKQHTIGYNKWA